MGHGLIQPLPPFETWTKMRSKIRGYRNRVTIILLDFHI